MLWLWLVLSSPVVLGQLSASEAEALMDQAAAQYQQGRYEEALRMYEQIESSGYVSAPLYYNMGNAHFKLNSIPRAILWYERAFREDPSDEDIHFNLALARTRIVDKAETVPQLFFVRWWNELRDFYSADGWARVALFFLSAALALLLVFLLSRHTILRRTAFWPALLALVIMLHALAFAWQKHHIMKTRPYAIIFTPAVTVKSSPDVSSVDLFVIHEGTRVQVIDGLGEWLEIRIPSGEKGWVDAGTLERI